VAEIIKSMFLSLLPLVVGGLVIGLCCAILPGGAFAYLQSSGVLNWSIRASERQREKRLRAGWLVCAAWVGGAFGGAFAFNSVFLAGAWDVYIYPHLMRDGQGGLVIVATCPLFGLIGSLLAVWGCRLFLCSEPTRLTIFPRLYSGIHPILNRTVFALLLIGGLVGLWVGSFLANWALLHPGGF